WQVTGVLGGEMDVAALVEVLTRRGVVGAAGRLLAGTGKGCRLAWQDAPDEPPPPAKKAAGTKATGKAAAAKATRKAAPAKAAGTCRGSGWCRPGCRGRPRGWRWCSSPRARRS